MKKSDELRQLQSLKRKEGFEIVGKAETEKRELSVEEIATLRSIETEVNDFDKQIEAAELREKFDKSKVEAKPKNDGMDPETRELSSFSMTKFFNAINRNEAVTGFEREVLDEGVTEARALNASSNGHYINLKALNAIQKRAMSAGSSSAGGNFIQTNKEGFFDVLRANRVLDKVGAEWEMGMVPSSRETSRKGIFFYKSTINGYNPTKYIRFNTN